MAKTYKMTTTHRLVNKLIMVLVRLGVKLRTTYVLTVRGRRSGKMRSVPVTLVEEDGKRWLVAPYGPVDWVHNARAAGDVTLTRGRYKETVRITELGPDAAAPILKLYATRVPVTRPYFDASPDDPVDAFKDEADRHPVFLIE